MYHLSANVFNKNYIAASIITYTGNTTTIPERYELYNNVFTCRKLNTIYAPSDPLYYSATSFINNEYSSATYPNFNTASYLPATLMNNAENATVSYAGINIKQMNHIDGMCGYY